MSTCLVLICAAHDGSGGFPADRPAAPRLLTGAAGLARRVPQGARVFLAPDRAVADTARAAGIDGAPAPELAEADAGRWAGLDLDTVAASDAPRLAAWVADPEAAPPGGESRAAQRARVAGWMAEQAALGGTVAALAPASSLRAAILTALEAPSAMARRIAVPTLSVVRLTHDGRRWSWRAGD